MPPENSCNMWVFREGRNTAAGEDVRTGLLSALRALSSPSSEALVDALLRAGELEVALADSAAPGAGAIAAITDAVASALVGLPGRAPLESLAAPLLTADLPASLSISTAEGFAYYALHPLDFADLADRVLLDRGAPASGPCRHAAVLGIRSIGAPLSAVVSAALARRGLRSQRITVRPTGHPFDRRTAFTPAELRWIAQLRARDAEFYVVDEGPGISGSSFLSVGDALLAAGVARERITFLCSRWPEPDALTAPDGAARWRSFRAAAVRPTRHVPHDATLYCGGGEWRTLVFSGPEHWPASWTQMERLKFLTPDRRRLYKFAGLGRYGQAVFERARLAADGGFGPAVQRYGMGFAQFDWLSARPAHPGDLNGQALECLAAYCAFRAREFPAAARRSRLAEMVRFNVAEEFGVELETELAPLADARQIITDSRMQPHEWLVTGGALLKTDSDTHGDDHFFPGPADIAWDLAGAMVEWRMPAAAADVLLARFERLSGDSARGRIGAYLLAYSVFRMAYCAMAAFVMRGTPEHPRLHAAWRHYRALAEARLPRRADSGASAPLLAADASQEIAAD
jgi:hypothetical protein